MDENNITPEIEETDEYVTFTVTAKDGAKVEMAVVDEFNYDRKNYVVGAIIQDDTINEDGYYIYRLKLKEEGFDVEKINDPKEYEKISKAYLAE